MLNSIEEQLIKEFNLKPFQVNNVIKLIDDGNTIPFIARYRKEMTGNLDDQILREFSDRLNYLRNFENRRNEITKLIEEQGKLTEDIVKSLQNAKTLNELEDIYRPYKPKRRTKATVAKEKGLEPFATILLLQNVKNKSIEEIALPYVNPEKGVNSFDEALAGAMDIIAEEISDNSDYRKYIRNVFIQDGVIISKAKKKEDSVYRMYYDFKEAVLKIAKHRVLAINRGEKEEFLSVSISVPEDKILDYLKSKIVLKNNSVTSMYVEKAIEDSYKRLIAPSIEREVRSILTEEASEQAIKVFAANLKNLLLQPPVKGKTVLGIDPGFRTGCKIAVVDSTGKVLDVSVIYPTEPHNRVTEAKTILKTLIAKHNVDIIAIGNGTASRETEFVVAELIREINKKLFYIIVNEAGASVYSASKLAAQEFPDFDVSLRSAVSIARRLQDPLAELVKIDPKSIGVGQYQHDMNQKRLDETLKGVVEDCVNSVGIDLNTASVQLLSYIAGINSAVAKNIVEYREKNGKFTNREQLKKVKKLGDKAFEQCAGFLRIPDGDNVLDNTSVHPESYPAAEKLLKILGYSLKDVKLMKIIRLKKEVERMGLDNLSKQLNIGIPTLQDIVKELLKPGRDFRDDLPKPVLMSDVLRIEDLKVGMVLTGTVRNVSDFGAFIDIGVHQDGLVHISELSDKYVRNPMDVVAVGDIVKVRIIDVDLSRKRISLSMKGM